MVGVDVVLAACVLVNLVGLTPAAWVLTTPRRSLVGPRLFSFSVGVVAGAMLLDVLPHLWEATGNMVTVLALFATALIVSRFVDRACSCRHPGADHPAHPGHSGGRWPNAGPLLLGDFTHCLTDGALIGGALAVGVLPGALAALTVTIHEVPRRIAIVTLLLRGGARPTAALLLTLCSGMGTALGGLLVWWSAGAQRALLPLGLAITAAATLHVVLSHSSQVLAGTRLRLLSVDIAVPFGMGVVVNELSHHLAGALG